MKQLRNIIDNITEKEALAEYKLSKLRLKNEDLITAKLHYLLTECGIFHFHVPNGGLRHRRTGAVMKAMGTLPGVADMCILADGGATLWLELKHGKGKQTESQKSFESNCTAKGHVYRVANGLMDALETVERFLDLQKQA